MVSSNYSDSASQLLAEASQLHSLLCYKDRTDEFKSAPLFQRAAVKESSGFGARRLRFCEVRNFLEVRLWSFLDDNYDNLVVQDSTSIHSDVPKCLFEVIRHVILSLFVSLIPELPSS